MKKIVSERSLQIEIPENTITDQFGWLSEKGNTREGVVRAYILKHPGIIMNKLTIENLVAINVWLNKWKADDENYFEHVREADLIFEKDGVYYLVETKRQKKYSRGWEQLGDLVDCFKSEFRKHRESYESLIPVLVTTTDKVDRIKRQWI